MSSAGGPHSCVLCNAKLPTKEDLQDHFRKHANKEIDGKGRPKKANNGGRYALASRILPSTSAHVAQANKVLVPAKSTTSVTPAAPLKPATEAPPANTLANNKPAVTTPGKKSIACDVCQQEFDSVTQAIQHKFRKHPNSAIKHFCPHCGMQFPLKISRDMHLNTHPDAKKDKSFPCADCGVIFHNEQAQTYHHKSTHKRIVAIFKPVVTPPPSKKIKVNNAGEAQSVFYCHLCGYEYIVKFNLQKHLEKQNKPEERDGMPSDLIKCTTCDALFYNKKAYENHTMYHKPGDLYVTSEEQRLQTVTRVDQDFDIRRVQSTADKFIPIYRPRNAGAVGKKKKQRKGKRDASSDSELSPDSSSMSSDSDSDAPLEKRVKHRSKKAASKDKKEDTDDDEPPPKKGKKRVVKPKSKMKVNKPEFVACN